MAKSPGLLGKQAFHRCIVKADVLRIGEVEFDQSHGVIFPWFLSHLPVVPFKVILVKIICGLVTTRGFMVVGNISIKI